MQIYRLARKISLVKKSKNDLFLDTNLGFLTLEGPGCHTVDNRSFSVAPRNFMSMTVQMGYVKGRWHQN